MAPELVALVERLRTEKLDRNQQEILDFVMARLSAGDRQIVVKAARQLGKSWFLCYLAIACALLIPGAQIKYAAPTGKMAHRIIRPHFRALTSLLPPDLWHFNAQQGEYTFFHANGNESLVVIGGCDAGNIESLRGQHAHIVIVDEAGFIADLRYAIDDVLMPQTINTRGVIAMASTPAKTPGHPFFGYCAEAEAEGRLIKRTIYDNPRLTLDDIRPLIKASRGEKSSTWRREYLVEDVVDAQTAVLPNATTSALLKMFYVAAGTDQRAVKLPVQELTPPQGALMPETYTSISLGFGLRSTGILFAYYDPAIPTGPEATGAIVIQAEHEIRGTDTRMVAEATRDWESRLWKDSRWEAMPFRRLVGGDATPFLMGQLQSEHKLRAAPPIPMELRESVNLARLRVEGAELRIHRDCEALQRQMQSAVWSTNMKSFETTEDDDNQPLVQALVQLVANVKRGKVGTGAAGGMRRLLSRGR